MPPSAPPVALPDEATGLVASVIEEHGLDTLQFTLGLAPLIAHLRSMSRFNVKTALEAAEAGCSATLLLQLRPMANKVGERVEARLIMGGAQQVTLHLVD